ncbi:TFIIB-type zinc ribbon-containing protein [Geomonas ferrireducens]|uniref:TFIIB-type zinc ribbon-containing protein n=1 Tax=Geomonas ferrireducens TaxID=2570227 RepID=UPI0010A8F229|nr:zf-TFIIB domain-containing protein [Geomonas ferrireducens]
MKCPVCNDANLVMSERQGIEIDYCPQCRGIWLDRGELDKIIERSAIQPQQPQPQPQQQQQQQQQQYAPQPDYHHAQHHGHKPYRKKSFFEELFD